MYKRHFLKKILILLSLIAVGFFAIYYFVYRDIKTKNEKVSILEYNLSQQDSRQSYILSTKRTIQNLSLDLIKVNNSIIPQDGDVHFIENIESLARQNGLTIEIQSLVLDDQALNSTAITVLDVKAKTSGAWNGTYTFLGDLESSPLKIKITRFAVANSQADSVGPQKTSPNAVWQGLFEISVLKYK